MFQIEEPEFSKMTEKECKVYVSFQNFYKEYLAKREKDLNCLTESIV